MYPTPSVTIDSSEILPEEGLLSTHSAQPDIDAAYSVKVFLDYHPDRRRPIAFLAYQCGLSEQRLRTAFLCAFNERLDYYWERVQWKALV